MNRVASKGKMPPSIDELMVGFLNRNEENDSLNDSVSDALGEIEPYEVSVGFRFEPRAAWQESLAILKLFGHSSQVSVPSEWASLVARSESVSGLPMAIGNFPQRVRDLSKLLNQAKLIPVSESRPASTTLRNWASSAASKGNESALLAVGVLRFAGDIDAAEELLTQIKKSNLGNLADLAENEQASLFWQQGKTEAAISIWRELPETIPVLFNRGMAALCLNQKTEARDCLKKVLTQLPDSNSWHHLAGLYLALAEI